MSKKNGTMLGSDALFHFRLRLIDHARELQNISEAFSPMACIVGRCGGPVQTCIRPGQKANSGSIKSVHPC